MTADDKANRPSLNEMALDIDEAADISSLVSTLLKRISKSLTNLGEGEGKHESKPEESRAKLKMSQE